MFKPFATSQDVIDLFRELSNDELTRTDALLPVVSDRLRTEAYKVGKDLDTMITDNPVFANVVKSVVVDVVARTLMTSTNQEPMSQFSESALGYSRSGTFLVPGGGLFIKNSELAILGLRRQRMGTIELYDTTVREPYGF